MFHGSVYAEVIGLTSLNPSFFHSHSRLPMCAMHMDLPHADNLFSQIHKHADEHTNSPSGHSIRTKLLLNSWMGRRWSSHHLNIFQQYVNAHKYIKKRDGDMTEVMRRTMRKYWLGQMNGRHFPNKHTFRMWDGCDRYRTSSGFHTMSLLPKTISPNMCVCLSADNDRWICMCVPVPQCELSTWTWTRPGMVRFSYVIYYADGFTPLALKLFSP